MKRRVLMFRKQSHDTIQGICRSGGDVVYTGQPCTVDAKHGGGFVGEMELVGGSAILIRKVDAQGEPLRNFGSLAMSTAGRGKIKPFVADGVLFPLSETRGVLFEDVDDRRKSEDEGPKASMPDCARCGKPAGGNYLCKACQDASPDATKDALQEKDKDPPPAAVIPREPRRGK
jgi:hypothetical protein